jgi:hypothetical protein
MADAAHLLERQAQLKQRLLQGQAEQLHLQHRQAEQLQAAQLQIQQLQQQLRWSNQGAERDAAHMGRQTQLSEGGHSGHSERAVPATHSAAPNSNPPAFCAAQPPLPEATTAPPSASRARSVGHTSADDAAATSIIALPAATADSAAVSLLTSPLRTPPDSGRQQQVCTQVHVFAVPAVRCSCF